MSLLTVKECRGGPVMEGDHLRAIAEAVGGLISQPADEILGDSRDAPISSCRAVCYAVARDGFGFHPRDIAKAWGRDRTTILSGLRRFEALSKHDAEWVRIADRAFSEASKRLQNRNAA